MHLSELIIYNVHKYTYKHLSIHICMCVDICIYILVSISMKSVVTDSFQFSYNIKIKFLVIFSEAELISWQGIKSDILHSYSQEIKLGNISFQQTESDSCYFENTCNISTDGAHIIAVFSITSVLVVSNSLCIHGTS